MLILVILACQDLLKSLLVLNFGYPCVPWFVQKFLKMGANFCAIYFSILYQKNNLSHVQYIKEHVDNKHFVVSSYVLPTLTVTKMFLMHKQDKDRYWRLFLGFSVTLIMFNYVLCNCLHSANCILVKANYTYFYNLRYHNWKLLFLLP